MTTSPRLGFTELEQGETVPETVVAEAFRFVEQGSNLFIVKDKDIDDPPGSPTDGDAYIVASASPSGAWTGWGKRIAFYENTAWEDITPIEGTFAYVQDENSLYRYDGSAWSLFSAGSSTLLLAPEWAPNFTDDGDVYIPAIVAMTIDEGNAAIGTGSLAYEKSTTATPDTFSSTSLPATLQAGAWLKVSATSVSGFLAAHLVRTA